MDNNDPRRSFLEATLKTLLSVVNAPAWVKAPATFISELSSRFTKLSKARKDALLSASDDDVTAAMQNLGLGENIRAELSAIRAAIEHEIPCIIPFPGIQIGNNVRGEGNIIAGGDVTIGKIDLRRSSKRSSTPVLPGTVATDPHKIGYLRYLADRFNKFKEGEVGKSKMEYAVIHVSYRRDMHFSIPTTPLDRFNEAVAYLQRRIRNTMLGRNLARQGNRLFESLDEFTANEGERESVEDLQTAGSGEFV